MPVEKISVKKKRSTIEDDQGGTGAFWDIIEKQDGIWVELKTLPEGTWFRTHNKERFTLIYIKGQERTPKRTCPCCTCEKHKTVLNSVTYWVRVLGDRLGTRRFEKTKIIDGDELVYIPKTFPSKFFAK